MLFLLRKVPGPGALHNRSAAVCRMLLGGFATFLLLTGGVLPSFYSAVLVSPGLLVLILVLVLRDLEPAGGIGLRPNLCTPGVVSLRYSTSLWQYPTSP